MGLTECTENLVSAYLKADAAAMASGTEGPLLKEAQTALVFLEDPAIVRLLLPVVEKDPKSLIRHAVLFDGPLMGHPAEPLLVKLLDSPDVEIRQAATHALGDCGDPILAKPIAKLAHDPDPRLHPRALFLAEHLPADAFALARPDLLPFLWAPDDQLRLNAITCFARHKDPAAGPPLLAFLKQDKMDAASSNVLLIALSQLTGDDIRYDQFNWGPKGRGNDRAIAELEAWIQQHPGSSQAVVALDPTPVSRGNAASESPSVRRHYVWTVSISVFGVLLATIIAYLVVLRRTRLKGRTRRDSET
jgi:hypothetical protein